MNPNIDTNLEQIYNSRIVDNYIKLIQKRYSCIDIQDLLDFAGMQHYEVADQGHWFTQKQINLFHKRLQQLTGNKNIAREAGRFAAYPEAIGVMRQYILGMVGPANAFKLLSKATAKFTKSANYESRKINSNKFEITVAPNKNAREMPFQCENRIGFFEAMVMIFNYKRPTISHPECVFAGGDVCRYLVNWESRPSDIWFKFRNFTIFASSILLVFGLFFFPSSSFLYLLPATATINVIMALICELINKGEIKSALGALTDTTEKLVDQININNSNALMTNEIGEVISGKTNIEGILDSVTQILQKRLDFERGLILLATPEKTHLTFRAGFGYDDSQLKLLNKVSFSLDKPESKGVFVLAYREQRPFLVNDMEDIAGDLSARSFDIAKKLGTKSFISCPIICDGESLGILAVDNLRSHRPLLHSDKSLLMGIAPVIGVSIRNAELLEIKEDKFKSTLQVMAASIDARDPLTAGHSAKVTEYAVGICKELRLPDDYCEMVRVAALLHDYGKLAVPDSILKKEGRLTSIEYEQVKLHTEKTRRILEEIKFDGIFQQVPMVAGSHHEKMDGSGYPMGLKGKQIPLGARIIAVQLLRNEAGQHFDPKIVEAFIRYFSTDKTNEQYPGIARRQARVPCEMDVALRVNNQTLSGQSADISNLGIYVSANQRAHEITAGTQVEITFSLPHPAAEPIRVHGRVAWVNRPHRPTKCTYPHGFGIEFTRIRKTDRKVVSEFVSSAHQKAFSNLKELFAAG